MDAYISIIMYHICSTDREESGRAGGTAALPRSPEGNCPSTDQLSVRPMPYSCMPMRSHDKAYRLTSMQRLRFSFYPMKLLSLPAASMLWMAD